MMKMSGFDGVNSEKKYSLTNVSRLLPRRAKNRKPPRMSPTYCSGPPGGRERRREADQRSRGVLPSV